MYKPQAFMAENDAFYSVSHSVPLQTAKLKGPAADGSLTELQGSFNSMVPIRAAFRNLKFTAGFSLHRNMQDANELPSLLPVNVE